MILKTTPGAQNMEISIGKLLNLFEKEKLFLYDESFLRDAFGLPAEDKFTEKFGFSFNEIIRVYRVRYARNLLIVYKLNYNIVWKLSGFESAEELEDALEAVVNYKKFH